MESQQHPLDDATPENIGAESKLTQHYDPIAFMDKEIEETAEQYLTEIISQIKTEPRSKNKIEKILRLFSFGLGITALVAGLYAISFSISHLPLRSHFIGVDTSALSTQVAYEKIQSELVSLTQNPIVVKSKQGEYEFTAAELGLTLNLAKSLNQAAKNPIVSLYSLIAPYSITPVVEIDEVKAKAMLRTIAKQGESAPQVADLEIKYGEVFTAQQINGRSINWDNSLKQINNLWLRSEQPIELFYDSIVPSITDQDVQVLASEIENILALPVIIEFEDKRAVISKKEIGNLIYLEKDTSTIQMQISEKLLWNALVTKFPGIEKPAQAAKLEIIEDKPVIMKSNTSLSLTSNQLKNLFTEITAQPIERKIVLTKFANKPAVTTEQLQALGITEKVSEYRQWFPPAQYRTQNVTTAAKYIDGTILLPGEIYSMNDTIRERTQENGYVPGIYISNGKFEEGYGGGVSIITTALWTAAFYGGLEKVEQRAHSIYIPRYQEGIEATVQWGSLDLKFRNSLDHAILIKTDVELDGVTIKIFGKKKFDQVIAQKSNRYGVKPYKTIYSEDKKCIPQEGQPGFGVTVTREMLRAGKVVQSDQFKTNYRISNEVICEPNPNKKKQDQELPEVAPEIEIVTAIE